MMILRVICAVILTGTVSGYSFDEKVPRQDVLHHLTETEKLFLFGDNPDPTFEIAHLDRKSRTKRSLTPRLNIDLSSSEILDPNFVLVRRWANQSEKINVIEEQDCYYRNSHSALYVCDDVRGILQDNDSNFYTIHPLPERFHSEDKTLHIISKKDQTETNSCAEKDDNTEPETKKYWRKHRRKRDIRQDNKPSIEDLKTHLNNISTPIDKIINKIIPNTKTRSKRSVLPAIFVETAVFIDRDLYKLMTINFPNDTEKELVRFVLAMINAVQLLYHDQSLGRPVIFILKRLEILHEDPANLKRPHDIDRFLSNFCTWQRLENPPGDSDPMHWDHALILTGLDLYVVSKNGKVSSQVVGLAPVAGMCTVTSSCTVNEGRHFESVYVVAHEIGHNLGMRHDGPSASNGCDPSAFLMSPTLGSGKITWSICSKNYLERFLDTIQSRCLLDHGNSAGQLDHSAEGLLPGERFDADQQCMLKYGKGSRHSTSQNLGDVCRDLHCQRERYTWTSHPALEGTKCGDDMYCRGGECVDRVGSLVVRGSWSKWSDWSECASACLLNDQHLPAATGVAVATRKCTRTRNNNGSNCLGFDKKYQSCNAQQCKKVSRLTVGEFADQICRRAREVDADLIGTGLQRIDTEDVSTSCAVWCDSRGGGFKSRGWTLPDGTACSKRNMFCINGVCQKFTCNSNIDSEFSFQPSDCEGEALQIKSVTNSITKSSTRRALPSWRPTSGCHYHCISPASGIRLVADTNKQTQTIQLCSTDGKRVDRGCSQVRSPSQFASMVCTKYQERVRRLSGRGMQVTPAIDEPDRGCRVACQDAMLPHRFYLVNGAQGWFPAGTNCNTNNNSYCISGKCLEFGPDHTPVSESVFTLPLLKTNAYTRRRSSRHKRSLKQNRITIKATLNEENLRDIIDRLNFTDDPEGHVGHPSIPDDIEVDFSKPIHLSPHGWD